jgi:hypothetical protein
MARMAELPKAGDGIAFENPADTNAEQGACPQGPGIGSFSTRGCGYLEDPIPAGLNTATWDSCLVKSYRKSRASPFKNTSRLRFSGRAGQPLDLTVEFAEGTILLATEARLDASRKCPLTTGALEDVFSRLHDTPYRLHTLKYAAEEAVFLPSSELNRLKRAMVGAMEAHFDKTRAPSGVNRGGPSDGSATSFRKSPPSSSMMWQPTQLRRCVSVRPSTV